MRPSLPAAARALRRPRATGFGLLLLLALTGGGGGLQASPPVQRWGEGGRLELLPLRQGTTEPSAPSTLLLLISPADLQDDPQVLLLTPSRYLDRRALMQPGTLCRMAWPVTGAHPHCLQAWPLRLEPAAADLRLSLPRSLEPGSAYGLVLQIRNPSVEGLHPLRLHAVRPDGPAPTYIGTWLLETLSQAD